jgi:hypothetical protein
MGKPPEVPDSGPDHAEVVDTIREATNDIEFGPDFVTQILLFFRENARDLFSGQTTFFILGSYETYPIRRLQFVERELNSRQMTYAFILCDLLDPAELEEYWERKNSKTRSDPSDAEAEGIDRSSDSGDESTEDEQRNGPMAHCQFFLLATYSDYVVPVFEGRHAGPSVELGELRNNFFDKSHVFTRDYAQLTGDDVGSMTEVDPDNLELGAGDKIDTDVDITNPYSRPQEDLFTLFNSTGRLYRWAYRADLAAEVQNLPKD